MASSADAVEHVRNARQPRSVAEPLRNNLASGFTTCHSCGTP